MFTLEGKDHSLEFVPDSGPVIRALSINGEELADISFYLPPPSVPKAMLPFPSPYRDICLPGCVSPPDHPTGYIIGELSNCQVQYPYKDCRLAGYWAQYISSYPQLPTGCRPVLPEYLSLFPIYPTRPEGHHSCQEPPLALFPDLSGMQMKQKGRPVKSGLLIVLFPSILDGPGNNKRNPGTGIKDAVLASAERTGRCMPVQ